MSTQADQDNLTIGILGDSGVGKSSLVHQFVYGRPFEDDDDTNGMVTYKKTVLKGGTPMNLTILDSSPYSGEFPRDMVQAAQCFVLVYSITSKSSFEEVQLLKEEIMNVGSTNWMILVGNKADLADQSEVQASDAAQLALDWNVRFLEVSAAQDKNVDMAFLGVLPTVKSKRAIIPETPQKRPSKHCCIS